MATRTSDDLSAEQSPLGEVLQNVTLDVKTIARDERELAQLEIQRTVKAAAIDGAVILLSGMVALIGLGLLCVAAVAALGYIISWLWLRLLIMALVYMMIGGILAAAFGSKLKEQARLDLAPVREEAKQTIEDVKHGLQG